MVETFLKTPKRFTKIFLKMQFLMITTIITVSLIANQQNSLFCYALESLILLMMFKIEGARPYDVLYIFILVAEVFGMWWIHKIIIGVLIRYQLKYKFYEIEIIDKGTYNAGFRLVKLDEQQLGIFYPTLQKGEHAKWVQTQNFYEVLYDLTFINPLKLRWIPFPLFKFFISFMNKVVIPAFKNTNLADDCSDEIPVIIFSHGLSSNLTSHSSYLSWLASNGYLVISMQRNNDDIRIPYDQAIFKKKELLTKIIYAVENHDLQIRIKEMQKVYISLIKGDLLRLFFPQQKQIRIKSIHFNGHSFGGSTCLETLAELSNKAVDLTLLQGVVCIDPWVFPMQQKTLQANFITHITIINSQTFLNRLPPEFKMVQKLSKILEHNKNNLDCFVLMGSDQIFSTDFVFVCGNGVTKITKCQNFAYSLQFYSLFQLITKLSIRRASNKEILQACQKFTKDKRIDSSKICVIKEWRVQQNSNSNDF